MEMAEVSAKRKGGARPGAGRPKGFKRLQREAITGLPVSPEVFTKEAAREYARQTIIAGLAPLLRAQMAHAQGIGHCYTRDKNGKFSRVESLAKIDELLTTGTENEHYFIFAKDPSAVAFKELLDRALDRPKEQAQEIHVSGEIELSARLVAARTRILDVIEPRPTPQIGDGGAREA
jgi:hypothetical protein